MHVLPHLGKHHRHARILADGHALLPGNLLIAAQDVQDLPRRGKGLLLLRGAQGTADVLRQEAVGLHTQLSNGLRHLGCVNLSHGRSSPCNSFFSRSAAAFTAFFFSPASTSTAWA